MNRAELDSAVSVTLGTTKKDAAKIVDAVCEAMVKGTLDTGSCLVPGIGKLKMVDVKASSGVMNGKAWTKAATRKIKLDLSKEGKSIGK